MTKHTNLILSHSKGKVNIPYTFKETNISVYSIEEAFYHIYHYYKESQDDLISDSLANWVEKELKLYNISSLMHKVMHDNIPLTDKFLKILNSIDYFDDNEILSIKSIIYSYENQTLWVRKKQYADKSFLDGQYYTALKEYKDITRYVDEPYVFNNMGLCHLHLYEYDQAVICFQKALQLDSHADTAKRNYIIALTLTEKHDDALTLLQDFPQNDPNIIKIYSEILIYKKDYKNAIAKLTNLVNTEYNDYALISISDCYLMLNNISKALEAIYEMQTDKKGLYFRQMSKISEKTGKLEDALSYMQKALFHLPDDWEIWHDYAQINYKLKEYMKCHGSALKAIRLNEQNELPYYIIANVMRDTLKQSEYKQNMNKIVDRWLHIL